MAGMTLLAADQLDWYVGKPWAMIIDVRNRREYEKGHVKVCLAWCELTLLVFRFLYPAIVKTYREESIRYSSRVR